jgi:hypothetical protein
MTDDFLARLRRLDGAEYPGRGVRLDPALVVRAGRRRRVSRRIATASTACVVAVGLGLGAPHALDRYWHRQPTPPADTPPTSVARTTTSPSPTSTDTGTAFATFAPAQLSAAQTPPPGSDLAPGVTAVTGLPTEPAVVWGVGDKTSDRWFYAGQAGETELVLHVGVADDGQVFSLLGVLGGTSSTLGSGGAETRFDAAPASATTVFPGHTGVFDAGLTPRGVAHAFYVTSGGIDMGDGTRHYALEVPTFALPSVGVAPDASQRMFAVAFTQPATDRLLDMESTFVFTAADGTIVGSGCAATGCDEAQLTQAYDEIRTILSGADPTACAEFPAVGGPSGGDVEGWWSSSPADAQGNILRDPTLWPPEPREHPRVALVDTDTAAVLSTWDRIACGPDPGFVATAQAGWPAHAVALVDMGTGETIGILGSAGNG